jgi:hypothetical protein
VQKHTALLAQQQHTHMLLEQKHKQQELPGIEWLPRIEWLQLGLRERTCGGLGFQSQNPHGHEHPLQICGDLETPQQLDQDVP